MEIKQFVKPSDYEKISKEDDGLLMYTGRILPTQQMNPISAMTDVMKDLSSRTFYVPLVDKNSPIAYSIAMHYHWEGKVVVHGGIESTLREILKYVYIIGGRDLVTKIKNSCKRCRYLELKTLNVPMGPISKHNVTIAPAFYVQLKLI